MAQRIGRVAWKGARTSSTGVHVLGAGLRHPPAQRFGAPSPQGDPAGLSSALPSSREELSAAQAAYFAGAADALQASITPDVDSCLARIAAAVPGLGPGSRVLDVGAGTGALLPHLQARGVADVLALDVSDEMLSRLRARFGEGDPLGNAPAVRTWQGDLAGLPAYQGPFDAAFFNAVFGNLYDPAADLVRAVALVRPGGHVVVSHPLGRHWHEAYRAANPGIVPHPLPGLPELEEMLRGLPLRLLSLQDDGDLYLALLQVPEGYAHEAAPILLEGEVVAGFGRGSRQLGVPTANLAPEPLREQLAALPVGVYFGWARLDAGAGAPEADGRVHKMVMNIGRRPTFEDADPSTSVEVHVMHTYGSDFYGQHMRVVALGYLRPELKFSGVQELLAHIHRDIGIARSQLDGPLWSGYRDDPFLRGR